LIGDLFGAGSGGLAQAEHDDAPFGEVDVDLPIALGPRLVKGVAGAVPTPEFRVLCAEDLRPLSGLRSGRYAIGMSAKVSLAHVYHRKHAIRATWDESLKGEDSVGEILMHDLKRLASQAGIRPTRPIGCCDQSFHFRSTRVSRQIPVEAMVSIALA